MKGCQFLNGLQLKNDKKKNLRTSKLNKDLSQIERMFPMLLINREFE